MSTRELKFNIIYTPGTVRYLPLFVFSLLKWSDCSFRLVANGCAPEEERLLQKLAERNPRLEFLALPFEAVVKHGEALSHLQSLERSDHFCFMDSDILATGEFSSELGPYLGRYAGVFSGALIGSKSEERVLPETYPAVQGRYSATNNGVCLGSTYWAMYDNRVLARVMRSTDVGFERRWWTDIPPRHQNWLGEMGLKRDKYDTGKLLNLVLLAQGDQLVFIESQFLQHIGAMSSVSASDNPGQAQRFRETSVARRVKWWLGRLMTFIGMKSPPAWRMVRWNAESKAILGNVLLRKRIIGGYFTKLLWSLFENRPLPAVPDMGDLETEERIGAVTADIMALHEEFGHQLAR